MNDHVCCACASKWQSAAEAAEAKLAEAQALKDELARSVVDLNITLAAERERSRKLREKITGLHRPDAAMLRALPGDQTAEDRYWLGWTDALDAALRDEPAAKASESPLTEEGWKRAREYAARAAKASEEKA